MAQVRECTALQEQGEAAASIRAGNGQRLWFISRRARAKIYIYAMCTRPSFLVKGMCCVVLASCRVSVGSTCLDLRGRGLFFSLIFFERISFILAENEVEEKYNNST